MGIKRPTWDESFMLQAIFAATRTTCLVRPVGAVLVKDKRARASGYNGAPSGVESCLDTEVCHYQNLAYQDSLRGLGKYEILKEGMKGQCTAVHAEKNAINQCSVTGISAEGCSLYVTNFPCPPCVRDTIIPNRIVEVVYWKDYLENPLLTMDERRQAEDWLTQAKIPTRQLDLSNERLQEILSLSFQVGERLSYRFIPPTSETPVQK